MKLLQEKGISAKVISVPSLERFEAQSEGYRASVVGTPKARVAVEAGIGLSWNRLIGDKRPCSSGCIRSGPAPRSRQLYEYFGITPPHIVEAVTAQL